MAPNDDTLGATQFRQPPGMASGTYVWAILGPSSANQHVKMALFEGYPYGTRVK